MPDEPKNLSNTTENLKKVNEKTAKVVDETSEVIKETSEVVDEQAKVNKKTAKVVDETSEVIKETSEVVDEQAKVNKKTAKTVDGTSEVIKETSKLVDEQSKVNRETAKTVDGTSEVIKETSKLVDEQSKVNRETADVFRNITYAQDEDRLGMAERANKWKDTLEDVEAKYSNFNMELVSEITNFGSIIESAATQAEKAQQSALGGISETMTESMATSLSFSERFAYRIHAQADRNITAMNQVVEGMEEMKTETGKFMEKRMVTMANQLLTADHKQAIEIKEQMTALRERAYLLQGEERERMLAMADSMEAGMGQLTSSASIFKESIFQTLPKLDNFVENTLLGGGILGKFAGGLIRASKAKKQAQAATDIQLEQTAQQDFANDELARARGADAIMGGTGVLTQEQMQSVTDSTNKYLAELVSQNRTILGLGESAEDSRMSEIEAAAEQERAIERRHQEQLDKDGQTVEISEGKCGVFSKIMGLLKGNFIGAAAAWLMSPLKAVAGTVISGIKTIGGGMAKVAGSLLPKSWSSKIGGFFGKLGKDQAGMVKQTKKSGGMLSSIVKKLSNTVKSIFGAISKVFKGIGKIIKQVVDVIMKVLTKIGKGISKLMKSLAKGISHFGSSKVVKGAFALLIVAAGIFVFAKAMTQFGKVTWKAVAVGVVSMTALGIGMAFMGKLTSHILKGAFALLIVAAATWVFSKAMIGFNSISWKAVAVGLVTVAAFGLVMAGLGFLAAQIAMGGAAMIVVAIAVFLLGKAMKTFTKISWKAVGVAIVSLVALAVAVGVLGAIMMSGVGAAAIVLGAAALIIIAVAVGILGLALIIFGKGIKGVMPIILMFGKIITKLIDTIADAFKFLINSIVPIIEAIAGLITAPIKAIGDAISSVIDSISGGFALIIDTVGDLVATVGEAIARPIEAIGDAIASVAGAIGDAISSVVDSISGGFALIIDTVGGLVETIGEAIARPIEAIGNAIASVAGAIGDAIVNVVSTITDSLMALSGEGVGSGLKSTASGIWALTKAMAGFLAVQVGGGFLASVGNAAAGVVNWIGGLFGQDKAPNVMDVLAAIATFPHKALRKTPPALDEFIGAIQRFSSMEIDGDTARETIGVVAGLAGAIQAFQAGTPGLLENLGDLVGGALSSATGWLGSLFGIEKTEKEGPLDILEKLAAFAPKVAVMGPALSEMVEGMLSLMAFSDAKVDAKAFKQFFSFLAGMPLGVMKRSADAITELADSIDHLADSVAGLPEIQGIEGRTAGGQALLAQTGNMVGPGAVITQNQAQNENLREEQSALQLSATAGGPAVNTLINNAPNTNTTMVMPPSPRNNEGSYSRTSTYRVGGAAFYPGG
jgi:phage-related protein